VKDLLLLHSTETPMPDTPQPEPRETILQRLSFERLSAQYLSNRRRIATVAAILIALFLSWHVVNGRNGLTSWQQKRAEDKTLGSEIDQLTQENARLSQHVDRLKSDPGAIEHEARERLHYARPNEIIYALPAPPQASPVTTPAAQH
jgi:cell division protein FtsB